MLKHVYHKTIRVDYKNYNFLIIESRTSKEKDIFNTVPTEKFLLN